MMVSKGLKWKSDLSAVDGARRAFKLPVIHEVIFAITAGICETLEGRVPYSKGDAILTGVEGEQWPVPQDYFIASYEPVLPTVLWQAGCYRKKKIVVWVMKLEEQTTISVASGMAEIEGRVGDWLVQYEPGRWGIVHETIFDRTYMLMQ